MTLAEIKTLLESVRGMEGKVAYNAFPVGECVPLPFICYRVTNTQNFGADDKVYTVIRDIDIELYTALKNPAIESAVETALDNAELFWDKTEQYIETERCYLITYEIEV